MALSPQQIKGIEEAKAQGLTREQALARVFVTTPQVPQKTGRFTDVGEDIATGTKSIWQSYRQRTQDIVDTAKNPTVRGVIAAGGNVPGLAGDIAFTGAQVAAKAFMRPEEEMAVGEKVAGLVEKTGIPQAISRTSEETQRDIRQGTGYLETLGLGLFSKLRRTVSRTPTTPTVTPPTRATTPTTRTVEQIGSDYANRLRQQAATPELDPRAREEAAQAAMTFKEKWIGLRPDEKQRLQQMGEGKITEYLDATHLRNISDIPTPDSPLPPGVWGPQELGNYYVTQAFSKLEETLNNTGSEIGQTRRKFSTVKLQQPQVDAITIRFNEQLNGLGLTVRNGQVVELPNKIAKTTGSDIAAIQSLYEDFLKFKSSPTIENAYALRTNFDSKIKFGQSARDVSNAVDPLSRSVRKTIADEAAKVIGRENAAELQKYSDFMDAYSDLKSYTDRAAGSEYLLRLVMSGRGREARELVNTIKQYTGIDLMNDASAMKIAVERFANESQQNLFKQEVTRAGYDIAGLFQQGPVGIIGTAAQRLAEYGIDPEEVIKAAAAGTGGYLLMTYMGEDGEFLPAGLAILAAMPNPAREEALNQAIKALDVKRSNLIASGLTDASPAVKANEKARKALEKEREKLSDSFNQAATPSTTSLTDDIAKAKAEGKTFEEWVKEQRNVVDDTKDYAMSHRPTEGPRAFNLTEEVDGEQMIPQDMYQQWYGSRGDEFDRESIAVLKRIKDNPDAEVTIYRASPKADFNYGDWVSFSKKYAQQHAESNGDKSFNVHELKVKAKDVRWAMDDVNEFGYYPENVKTRTQLKAEWDKVTTPNSSAVSPSLLEEAKKYKSAEELKTSPIYKNFTQDVIGNSKVGRGNLLNAPDSSRYAWRSANDASVLIQNADLPDGAFKSIVGRTREDVIASLQNNLETYLSEKTVAPHGDAKKIQQVIDFSRDVLNTVRN